MVVVDEKKLPVAPTSDAIPEDPPAYSPGESSRGSSSIRAGPAPTRPHARGHSAGARARTRGAGPSRYPAAGPSQAPAFANASEQTIVRTNHLKLHRQNDALKGRWLIDTSLQLPAGLLDPLPEGETVRPNLYLSAENGQVHADVEIEGSKAERAVVVASSTNGSINVQILRRTGPLSLAASSTNGQITIFLPQDFQGPFNWKTKNGTTKFSAMLQSRLTQFGQKRKTGGIIETILKNIFPSVNDTEGMEFGFVGQWVGSGYEDVDNLSDWKGDYCEVRGMNGSLRFAYIDEPKEPNVFEGLLKGLFGGGEKS